GCWPAAGTWTHTRRAMATAFANHTRMRLSPVYLRNVLIEWAPPCVGQRGSFQPCRRAAAGGEAAAPRLADAPAPAARPAAVRARPSILPGARPGSRLDLRPGDCAASA